MALTSMARKLIVRDLGLGLRRQRHRLLVLSLVLALGLAAPINLAAPIKLAAPVPGAAANAVAGNPVENWSQTGVRFLSR